MGWLARRRGRRRALAAGYAVGALGAVVVVAAATWTTPTAFLVGSLMLGAANTAIFMSRYAAAAATGSSAQQQARAIATVLTATSLGAVASPMLIGPLDQITASLGLPTYTGLYGATFVVYAVAAAMQHGEPRPSRLESDPPETTAASPPAAVSGLRTALLQLGSVNLLMVAIMTVAPVHLADHGADSTTIGMVVAAHVAAMFGPSPLSGRLVSLIGPRRTFLTGMCATTASGVVALLLDLDHAPTAAPALVLLGIGWNLGVVAASALLVASQAGPTGESRGEISMGIAAGIGSAAAGAGVAAAGLAWVWAAATALAVIAAVAFTSQRWRGARGAAHKSPVAPPLTASRFAPVEDQAAGRADGLSAG